MSELDVFEDLPYDDEVYNEEEGRSDILFEEEQQEIYDTNDFISGPYLSEGTEIPENILEFDHSFGYDCKRFFNLICPEDNVLIYASGNFITFFDVEENLVWFRRSAFGEGIGHICKNPNPNYPHVAVAENGVAPPIIIYEWPSFEIFGLLKGGSARRYSHLAYSPDGELLCSQGGEPDYLITIWNWKKRRIMLRMMSYINDIYNVVFSPTVPGHLTSAGNGHIKFWKMCQTFTGLKLKGQIGRFGKTEISDVIGLYPMPDEKVCSGCEWGNILIWDEGLITKEVTRKLNKRCHNGPITQFEYNNGELTTIAMDGYVRIWFYETIELANPPEEARFVAVEPNYEFYIAESKNVKTELMCLVKKRPKDPEDFFYYAQDGNGGILRTFISTELEDAKTERLLVCHAGAVVGVASCPHGPYICSLGIDGRIFFYNYTKKKLLLVKQLVAKGRKILWLPLSLDRTGSLIVLGFDDGVLRIISVDTDLIEKSDENAITFIQIYKPHTKAITNISLNLNETLLVTTGEDKTLFIFYIQRDDQYPKLVPIGFINLPEASTYLTWNPKQPQTVLVVCNNGDFIEADLPLEPLPEETEVSYLLKKVQIRQNKFVSVKSMMLRNKLIAELQHKKELKLEQKRQELEKLRRENPGVKFDEAEYLADSEEDPELPELYIPPPHPILFAMYTPENTIWLSMGDYDMGYIYEYTTESKGPVRTTLIPDCEHEELISYIFDPMKQYLIIAKRNGQIRINTFKYDNFRDLNDYWLLSMHDNYNGIITQMCFSYDYRNFFTCGEDGNIFSYNFNPPYEFEKVEVPEIVKIKDLVSKSVEDITDREFLSLEQAKNLADHNKRMAIADSRKQKVLRELRVMAVSFRKLLQKNKQLLPSQMIPHEEFLLDDRITEDLNQRLSAEVALVNRKLAFDVEKSRIKYEKLMNYFIDPTDYFPFTISALRTEAKIHICRHRIITKDFFDARELLLKKIAEDETRKRKESIIEDMKPKIDIGDEGPPPVTTKTVTTIESFLMGLSPSTIEFRLTAKINRLLRQYRNRRAQMESRKREWDYLNARKPIPGVNHPDDEKAIKDAEAMIGDFKLKSAIDYKPPVDRKDTTLSKYTQLLNTREDLHNQRRNYNNKLVALREEKVRLIEKLKEMAEKVRQIHNEIPEDKRQSFPKFPEVDMNEFPERLFEVNVNPDDFDESRSKVRKPQFDKPSLVINPSDYVIQLLGLYYDETDKKQWFKTRILDTDSSTVDKSQLSSVSALDITKLKSLCEHEKDDTPWEAELREIRLISKIFEQDQIIREARLKIKTFDEDLEGLIKERLLLNVDLLFKEHYSLGLIQELIILKEFEAIENSLEEKINDILDELYEKKRLSNHLKTSTEISSRNIVESTERIKEIQAQFQMASHENRFLSFLKRIFKRKYKPPKIKLEDDEEEESSSDSDDSSESDEDASLTSEQLMILKLDEKVCPSELEPPTLFDLTYELRGERHSHEQRIIEETKNIESYKRQIETTRKEIFRIDAKLKVVQDELDNYQREKQRRLNEVECLLVLKLNQIRNFTPDGKISHLRDSLLFNKETLESLDRRIAEIKNETLEQRAKHRKNIVHLQRMKADCKYMDTVISDLNAEIKKTMKVRFGSVVDIEDLEKSVLRKLVHDLKVSMISVRQEQERELSQWKEKISKKEVELAKAIQENTEKLNLVVVLEEEKNNLHEILKLQAKREKSLIEVDDGKTLQEDLNKLTRIAKTQDLQMQALKDEINILKMKCPSPKPERELEPSETDRSTPASAPEKVDAPSIIDEVFNSAPVELQTRNTELMKSLIAEFIGFVYTNIPQQAKADKFIKEHVTKIFEVNLEETTDSFMIIVKQFVHEILNKLKIVNDLESEDTLTDIIADIIWEMRTLYEALKTNQRLEERKADKRVNEEDMQQTANALFMEIVTKTLKSETPKTIPLDMFEESLVNVIVALFEELPPALMITDENISKLIEELNKATIVDENSPIPKLSIDKMLSDILERLKTSTVVDLTNPVTQLLEEIMKQFLNGVLLPDLGNKVHAKK